MEAISKELFEALQALCDMWSQYCPPPNGHLFMSAGEGAADVLDKYRLLKEDEGTGGVVDWQRLEELRKQSALPNDWKEVTKELPKDLEDVLGVHYEAGGVGIVYYSEEDKKWYSSTDTDRFERLITHWQLLPTPPTGEVAKENDDGASGKNSSGDIGYAPFKDNNSIEQWEKKLRADCRELYLDEYQTNEIIISVGSIFDDIINKTNINL